MHVVLNLDMQHVPDLVHHLAKLGTAFRYLEDVSIERRGSGTDHVELVEEDKSGGR